MYQIVNCHCGGTIEDGFRFQRRILNVRFPGAEWERTCPNRLADGVQHHLSAANHNVADADVVRVKEVHNVYQPAAHIVTNLFYRLNGERIAVPHGAEDAVRRNFRLLSQKTFRMPRQLLLDLLHQGQGRTIKPHAAVVAALAARPFIVDGNVANFLRNVPISKEDGAIRTIPAAEPSAAEVNQQFWSLF